VTDPFAQLDLAESAPRLAPVEAPAPEPDLVDFDAIIAPQITESGLRNPALSSVLLPALAAHTPDRCAWRVRWVDGGARVHLDSGAVTIGGFRVLELETDRAWAVDVGYRYQGQGAIRRKGHDLGRTVPDVLVPAVEALEAALSAVPEAT
jgi:hypothetical protein